MCTHLFFLSCLSSMFSMYTSSTTMLLPAGQIVDYLNAYIDRFGFRDRIALRNNVLHVEARDGGGYVVTTQRCGSQKEKRVVPGLGLWSS